jgi:hypothetical protein
MSSLWPICSWRWPRRRGGAGLEADLAPLIDRLGNRLGFARLARAEPRDATFLETGRATPDSLGPLGEHHVDFGLPSDAAFRYACCRGPSR